jgi:formylglycine-generating enzyme required for sulfatase activity
LFLDAGGYDDESVWLPAGWEWRQKFSMTRPQYWRRGAREPNHPVAGVSWYEAMAYCRWVTDRMKSRGELEVGEAIRLPTEAEREKGARGGLTLDRRRATPNPMPERRYPWGEAFMDGVANTVEAGVGATTPVGMFPDGDSPYRLTCLGGNVLEWCTSRATAYPYHSNDGREEVEGDRRVYRAARGGAFPFRSSSSGAAYRHWYHPDFRGAMVGLRVVRARPPG